MKKKGHPPPFRIEALLLAELSHGKTPRATLFMTYKMNGLIRLFKVNVNELKLMAKNFNWGKLLKVVIAVLTALAGSLGIVSCMQ